MSRVVWFEMPAQDTGRAREFYGQLFGWEFEPFSDSPEYHIAAEASGAIHAASDGGGPRVYFGAEDIEAEIERVRELGGEAGPVQDIPDMGRYAHCTDTEGNRFGLYQEAEAA